VDPPNRGRSNHFEEGEMGYRQNHVIPIFRDISKAGGKRSHAPRRSDQEIGRAQAVCGYHYGRHWGVSGQGISEAHGEVEDLGVQNPRSPANTICREKSSHLLKGGESFMGRRKLVGANM